MSAKHTPEPSEKDAYMAALLDNASSQLARKDADLREALDALAEVEATIRGFSKMQTTTGAMESHLNYGMEPGRAILRKHGRAV